MKWDPAYTPRLVALLLAVAAAAWLLNRTEWVDIREPLPMSEELRADGTVVARHLLQQLGLRTRTSDNLQQLPPPTGTLVLSTRFWNLLGGDERLRRWVELGGHLVVDHVVLDDPPAAGWLPVALLPREKNATRVRDEWCRVLSPGAGAAPAPALAFGSDSGFVTCARAYARLRPAAAALWALHSDELGLEVQRMPLGRGRVTAFAGHFAFDSQRGQGLQFTPGAPDGASFQRNFSNRGLLEGDNAALLAALVDARPGDEVWFVTKVQRPALPLWLWQQAAPALLLAAMAVALALWRGALRFGPLQAEPPPLRRAVSTQIEGVADFLHAHQPLALHAAALRALREAAQRRLPGWQRLPPAARTLALARASGLALADLEMAIEPNVPRDASAWSHTLALLETARRALLDTDLQHHPTHPTHRYKAAP